MLTSYIQGHKVSDACGVVTNIEFIILSIHIFSEDCGGWGWAGGGHSNVSGGGDGGGGNGWGGGGEGCKQVSHF